MSNPICLHFIGTKMGVNRFEKILECLQFSSNPNGDQQILDFIAAVNKKAQESIIAGHILCFDESMIKAFHRNLYGKIKIMRKPRPQGNELKTLCDSESMIVLNMELNEGKVPMSQKEYFDTFGATAACGLRLCKPWHNTGRIVCGDSWFGSVKLATALLSVLGLYSIMVVKTATKLFPKELFTYFKKEIDPKTKKFTYTKVAVKRGDWISRSASIKSTRGGNIKVMAVRYTDLKKVDIVTTCSSVTDGNPRTTKHCGEIARPTAAQVYYSNALKIDVHNHFRTGSQGLEDVMNTRSYHIRQFCGVMGFVFTNAFLACRKFSTPGAITDMATSVNAPSEACDHAKFRIKLSNTLITFGERHYSLRHPETLRTGMDSLISQHELISLAKVPGSSRQRDCYNILCASILKIQLLQIRRGFGTALHITVYCVKFQYITWVMERIVS